MSNASSPSEDLATILVDSLIEKGLFRTEKRDALITKIASGTMKGEDWTLEIDLAQAKDGKK